MPSHTSHERFVTLALDNNRPLKKTNRNRISHFVTLIHTVKGLPWLGDITIFLFQNGLEFSQRNVIVVQLISPFLRSPLRY